MCGRTVRRVPIFEIQIEVDFGRLRQIRTRLPQLCEHLLITLETADRAFPGLDPVHLALAPRPSEESDDDQQRD
jgi:hypothetical protein